MFTMGPTQLLFMAALCWVTVHSRRLNSRQPDGSKPSRIVGGSSVPYGEYVPYQVSMQYETELQQFSHFCGGSIISPNRILTAAHCCEGLNIGLMYVLAGTRSFNDPGVWSKVTACIIHPEYQELQTSDIAVLKIEKPLRLDNITMAAIDYSDEEFVGGGVSVTLTGWGLRFPVPIPLLSTLNYPRVLQRMSYFTMTNEQCRARGMTDVTDTEICARGPLRGACSGDSGGPLVTNEGALKQVGVVSYGLIVCGLFISPDVYTRVSTFKTWIDEQVRS